MDQFYALVTGQEDAFYQICMVLPEVVRKVVESEAADLVPQDTVFGELKDFAEETHIPNRDLAMAMAIYMLGFSTYKGFLSILSQEQVTCIKQNTRISEYIKGLLAKEEGSEAEKY